MSALDEIREEKGKGGKLQNPNPKSQRSRAHRIARETLMFRRKCEVGGARVPRAQFEIPKRCQKREGQRGGTPAATLQTSFALSELRFGLEGLSPHRFYDSFGRRLHPSNFNSPY